MTGGGRKGGMEGGMEGKGSDTYGGFCTPELRQRRVSIDAAQMDRSNCPSGT